MQITFAGISYNSESIISESMLRLLSLAEENDEIILVDGNSVDRTRALARACSPRIKVINSGRANRLFQRLECFHHATGDLIVILDIDDHIDKKSLRNNIKYLIDNDLDGVQFPLRSLKMETLSQCSWDALFQAIYKPKSQVNLLGRPCIEKTVHLKSIQFPDNFKTRGEDTFIGIRLEELYGKMNYRTGCDVAYKDTSCTLNETFYKFFSYGAGDAFNIIRNNRMIVNIIFHQLIRYPFIYGLRSIIFHGRLSGGLIPVYGLTRFIGMCVEITKVLVRRTVDILKNV